MAHTIWAGNDRITDLNYLILETPKTAFKTDRVNITRATNVVSSWNEIDAVQLIGADQVSRCENSGSAGEHGAGWHGSTVCGEDSDFVILNGVCGW